eukprot:8150562-Pyramimonas_sp.AAC.1
MFRPAAARCQPLPLAVKRLGVVGSLVQRADASDEARFTVAVRLLCSRERSCVKECLQSDRWIPEVPCPVS